MNKTIEETLKSGLCTGCGTCISLCPSEAIELIKDEKRGIYLPKFNEGECNCCEICYNLNFSDYGHYVALCDNLSLYK